MKIGFKSFIINPPFMVNRMLSKQQHQKCADDLHCRILMLEKDGKPLYHVSVDTVEIYLSYRDRMKEVIESKLGYPIDLITSATHSHYCPCLTTDTNYQEFLLDRIAKEITDIKVIETNDLSYSYQYEFFDKTGKSRISGHPSPYVYAENLSFYADGKKVACILMYNSHPTTMPMRSGDFTSEYPGYVIKKLSEKYPDVFFSFMLGPAGDISSRFTRRKQDYEEISYLADMLSEEYEKQFSMKVDIKPVSELSYEEKIVDIQRVIPDVNLISREGLSDREIETIEKAKEKAARTNIDELVKQHMFTHLRLSKDYSIIFEPFETFSAYYRYVNKDHCSLITISNGFDHYIPDIDDKMLTMEVIGDTVSSQTKMDIKDLLNKWGN